MNYKQAWEKYAPLTWEHIPPRVQQVAHQCVLDWFGCALAGSREPLAHILREEFAHRSGNATVLGAALSCDAPTAALLNGASGHALDFDDTSSSVGCHATAPVFPAALAVAEEIGATGAELMTAFVVGVEIEGRVGRVIGAEHYNKGWHTTATFGTFGAAAAVAHLLKLDNASFHTAMGLAASAASGVKANFGTMTKPLHAGQAAERGMLATRLAARGFTANPDAVYANQGYIQAAGSGAPFEERVANLDDRWLIEDSLFKYHAACYLTHASIESVLRLRTKVKADQVSAITLTVNPNILNVCGIPEPTTGLEGKFSLRGTTAMAWLGVDLGNPDVFSDAEVNREDVQALLRRVQVDTDSSLTTMQTRVQCTDAADRVLEDYHDTGVAESDLDAQGKKLVRKFASLTTHESQNSEVLAENLLTLAERESATIAV